MKSLGVRNDLETQDHFEVRSEKKPSWIMEWLGLGSTIYLQRETENANWNKGKAFTVSSSETVQEYLIIGFLSLDVTSKLYFVWILTTQGSLDRGLCLSNVHIHLHCNVPHGHTAVVIPEHLVLFQLAIVGMQWKMFPLLKKEWRQRHCQSTDT